METIIAALSPHLIEAFGAVLAAVLAWAANTARRKWGVDIEARHREALQSALMTGARLAIERKLDLKTAIGLILGHVEISVPDALRGLRPTAEALDNLARSKLTEAARSAGDDRLLEALRRAGAPV